MRPEDQPVKLASKDKKDSEEAKVTKKENQNKEPRDIDSELGLVKQRPY